MDRAVRPSRSGGGGRPLPGGNLGPQPAGTTAGVPMTSCTRTPGCLGEIEDGYCNVCGMAVAANPAVVAAAASPVTASPVTASPVTASPVTASPPPARPPSG